MANIRLQELMIQLEAIRQEFGGGIEVFLDTDGENLHGLDAVSSPHQHIVGTDYEEHAVVLTSFQG